nr:MAG TPA: hypothetical protein [Caudoviricetes sp.]
MFLSIFNIAHFPAGPATKEATLLVGTTLEFDLSIPQ